MWARYPCTLQGLGCTVQALDLYWMSSDSDDLHNKSRTLKIDDLLIVFTFACRYCPPTLRTEGAVKVSLRTKGAVKVSLRRERVSLGVGGWGLGVGGTGNLSRAGTAPHLYRPLCSTFTAPSVLSQN